MDPASFTGAWGKAKDGQTNGTDCFVNDPNEWSNAGCGILNSDQASYGVPFNDHKGYVRQYAVTCLFFGCSWDTTMCMYPCECGRGCKGVNECVGASSASASVGVAV